MTVSEVPASWSISPTVGPGQRIPQDFRGHILAAII
jgi:hypothetical protein